MLRILLHTSYIDLHSSNIIGMVEECYDYHELVFRWMKKEVYVEFYGKILFQSDHS
jgi:hypothetical protein